MNFPRDFSTASRREPTWRGCVVFFRRLREAATLATRGYCERQVQRALMIDPRAGDRMTVDVHFCDVR